MRQPVACSTPQKVRTSRGAPGGGGHKGIALVLGEIEAAAFGVTEFIEAHRRYSSLLTRRWREMDSNYWSRHGETPFGRALWFPRTAPPARRGTDLERDEKFESGFLHRRVSCELGPSSS